MATIHGKRGRVLIQGPGAEAEQLSEAADWSIDMDATLDEDPALGDDWTTAVKGLKNWSGSLTGNYDTTSNLAFDAFSNSDTPRKIYIYPDFTNRPTAYYYGSCWPRVSVSGGVSSKVTFSGDITGDGPVSKNP
jgi:hypothetical protein